MRSQGNKTLSPVAIPAIKKAVPIRIEHGLKADDLP
jgi:site-specific recombinase XerC